MKLLPNSIVVLLLAVCTAQAAVINLVATLDPANEVPPAVAPGANGSAAMVLDTLTLEFGWVISFDSLTGAATAAHFHAAPAGLNGAAVLNLDDDPGVVFSGIGASTGTFIGGKVLGADEVNNILAGLWYINIHTATHPGGELRGQVLAGEFVPTVVPLPPAVWLFGCGLIGLIAVARNKTR